MMNGSDPATELCTVPEPEMPPTATLATPMFNIAPDETVTILAEVAAPRADVLVAFTVPPPMLTALIRVVFAPLKLTVPVWPPELMLTLLEELPERIFDEIDNEPPVATFTLIDCDKVRLVREIVSVDELLSIMSPEFAAPEPKVMAFPPKVNAPAVLLKERPSKVVPAVKLLFVVRFVVPANVKEFVATGAVPPQLPAVIQLPSAPPPFQVEAPA
jgi:hypothetical protein